MKKLILIYCILIFTFINCKKQNQSQKDKNISDFECFFSKSNNISYFFPQGFRLFIAKNEIEDDSIISKISNIKLKKILSRNYIDSHILPIAKNFQFLYKDCLLYTSDAADD